MRHNMPNLLVRTLHCTTEEEMDVRSGEKIAWEEGEEEG